MKLVYDLTPEELYSLTCSRKAADDEACEIVRDFVKSGISKAKIDFAEGEVATATGRREKIKRAINKLGFKDVTVTTRQDLVFLERKPK